MLITYIVEMLDETKTITGYDFSGRGRFLALENKTKINNLKEEKCFHISPFLIFLVWPNDEIISLGSQNMPEYLYLEKEELIRL